MPWPRCLPAPLKDAEQKHALHSYQGVEHVVRANGADQALPGKQRGRQCEQQAEQHGGQQPLIAPQEHKPAQKRDERRGERKHLGGKNRPSQCFEIGHQQQPFNQHIAGPV